jgi:hypothetical protein
MGRLTERKYCAFISYTQLDRAFAKDIQSKLEAYVVPRAIRLDRLGVELDRKPLKPVFRDQDELVPGENLPERLRNALNESEYLIVICSPNAVRSEWVDKEILNFIQLRARSKVLLVVIDGEPNAEERGFSSDIECLPSFLRMEQTAEALWIDWRVDTKREKRRVFLQLVAALLQLDSLDELIRRDAQARRKRRIAAASTAIGVVALVATLAYVAWDMTYSSVSFQTARFEEFYEKEITAFFEDDVESARADVISYTILAADDLNSDGVIDFITLNQSTGFCGSSGCAQEAYIGNAFGDFEQLEYNSAGGNSLSLRNSDGSWKDIFTTDSATLTSYAVHYRHTYVESLNAYHPLESWFCQDINFEYCRDPLVFCAHGLPDDVEPRLDAPVYRKPDPRGSPLPQTPEGFSWAQAASADGSWFMVHYKFDGVLYVRREDMTGTLPTKRLSCSIT